MLCLLRSRSRLRAGDCGEVAVTEAVVAHTGEALAQEVGCTGEAKRRNSAVLKQHRLCVVQEGRDFVAALREVATAPVVYAEIPHAQHAFDVFGSPHGHYTADAVEKFLDWVRAKQLTLTGVGSGADGQSGVIG